VFHNSSNKCVWLQEFHHHSSSKSKWPQEFHHHNSSSKSEWLLECLCLSSSSSKFAWRLEFSNSKCNFPLECHHSSTRQCCSNKQQQQRRRHSSNGLPLVLILSKGSRSAYLQVFLLSSTRRC